MNIAGKIFLKRERDGPVRGGNPWIFSQAIARVEPLGLAAGWYRRLFWTFDAFSLSQLLRVPYHAPISGLSRKVLEKISSPRGAARVSIHVSSIYHIFRKNQCFKPP